MAPDCWASAAKKAATAAAKKAAAAAAKKAAAAAAKKAATAKRAGFPDWPWTARPVLLRRPPPPLRRPLLLRRLAALIGPRVSVQRDRQASAAKKATAAAKKATAAKKDGCPDWPQSFSSERPLGQCC